MLKKNWWFWPRWLAQLAWYSINSKNVPILSDHSMLLEGKTCVLTYFSKVAIGIGRVSVHIVLAFNIVLEPTTIRAVEVAKNWQLRGYFARFEPRSLFLISYGTKSYQKS